MRLARHMSFMVSLFSTKRICLLAFAALAGAAPVAAQTGIVIPGNTGAPPLSYEAPVLDYRKPRIEYQQPKIRQPIGQADCSTPRSFEGESGRRDQRRCVEDAPKQPAG